MVGTHGIHMYISGMQALKLKLAIHMFNAEISLSFLV